MQPQRAAFFMALVHDVWNGIIIFSKIMHIFLRISKKCCTFATHFPQKEKHVDDHLNIEADLAYSEEITWINHRTSARDKATTREH